MTLKKKNCPNIIKIIPIIYIYFLVSTWSSWFKYEINSLIYTLSFFVIYFSNCNFYSASQTLSLFKKHFLTGFTKHSAFWKSTFSLCTFWKLNFFKKPNFWKPNQTHPKSLQAEHTALAILLTLQVELFQVFILMKKLALPFLKK